MTSEQSNKLQRHKWWFRIFLILAIVGFIDVASRQVIGDPDIGMVTIVSMRIVGGIFGGVASSIIFSTLYVVTSFWIIWFGIAMYEWRAIKKLRTGKSENHKPV